MAQPPTAFVCRALGSRAALADLLGVDRELVAHWIDGARRPSAPQARRIASLAAVLVHLQRAEARHGALSWLRSPSAALDGAVPVDVALVDGSDRVIEAFEREIPGR